MARLFDLPVELLEAILVKFSTKELFVVRGVSTTFRTTITASPALRCKLFLEAMPFAPINASLFAPANIIVPEMNAFLACPS